jgi:hypothetical protein
LLAGQGLEAPRIDENFLRQLILNVRRLGVFPMRRKLVKFLWISVVVAAACTGGILAFRAYKIGQVEKLSEHYAMWLEKKVISANPVRVQNAYGRKEPEWFGITNIHVAVVTKTGATFTINALIEASLTDTKIKRLDLYFRNGAPVDKMTSAEMAKEMRQPPMGKTVEIPVSEFESDQPLDLQKLLPEAF